MNLLKVDKTIWDLSLLYKNENDPKMKKDRKIIAKNFSKFIKRWQKRDDYLKNPKLLKQALGEYELLFRNHGFSGKEGYYFWLRSTQDQNDPNIKARNNQIEEFGDKNKTESQFFELKISKIDPKKQKEFLNSPLLKDYVHFLEKLFKEAPYMLSDQEEKILTLKSKPAHTNWVNMVSGFLSKEEREVLVAPEKKKVQNFSQILSLIDDKNKKVRDSAAVAFNDILSKHKEVAENEINSILANKKTSDQLRDTPRADFSRHLADDIDSKVVDTLIKAVSARFKISKDYYQLKAKLLKLPKLKYHERNVEYGEVSKKYSYQEATNLVHKVLRRVDPKYAEVFGSFIKNNQIDVYPRKNKKGGAFCAYWVKNYPTFALLNFDQSLGDVITLAHELGHGINFELTKIQNALNFGTPLSITEVSSNFLEDFVFEEILKEADDQLKLVILMSKLNTDISSIQRQIACYMFEQQLHQDFRTKGYLSHQEIGKLFLKHMESYMGEFVEQSAGAENWWVYWGHIRQFFYNYSYANGLLISKSLQAELRKDPAFIKNINYFMSAGMSDSPTNIFKKIGIDITDLKFWNQGLDEIEALLKETEKLAKKLGKI